ncbi:M20 family metallopeptidase [Paenibacillus gansuensis]|uniref:Peptidase M20 domain-containing protein 2 n=1 Tax=Paenibacillus gansuensis TaxID=306542 RepID=A0ABW5PGL6_9BACL
MSQEKRRAAQWIEQKAELWRETSRTIWENPELGHQEYRASALLSGILEEHGFQVERGTAGLETAFRAVYDSGKPGPHIAYLSEYDALPGLGHACGHNLIGVMSVAAAMSLAETLDQIGGTVTVFGTPAEETSGAKVTMAEQGYFEGIDAAMMAHPASVYERSGKSLAMEAIQFEFHGKTAHAASQPYLGVNALDAAIQTFNGINALRQQLRSDVRIHGIIKKGGEAANVVPDYSLIQFYVRTGSKSTLPDAVEKVKNCARGAAAATGCRLEISNYELGYDNLVTNEALSDLFTGNLVALGVAPEEIKHGLDHGSIDMGNVSQVVPAIHPYIKMPDSPYGGHTAEFCEAAGDERGQHALLMGAKALAWTGLDLLEQPLCLQDVREEFAKATGTAGKRGTAAK